MCLHKRELEVRWRGWRPGIFLRAHAFGRDLCGEKRETKLNNTRHTLTRRRVLLSNRGKSNSGFVLYVERSAEALCSVKQRQKHGPQ